MDTFADHDPFAPLSEAERARGNGAVDAHGGADIWHPVLPAPEEPPKAAAIRHRRHGTAAARWTYRDAQGRPLFAVVRFDLPGGGKEVLPLSYGVLRGARGWRFKAPPSPRPLYGLDKLAARPDAPVLVVEGEKAADAAAALFPDRVVTTWQGGSHATGKADWSPLRGRRVIIWPDNDAPGLKAADLLVPLLRQAGAASVRVVSVPTDWPEGWDVADPLPPGAPPDALARLLAEAAEPSVDGASGAVPDGDALNDPPLRVVTVAELLRMELPPRQHAIAPVLPLPGLAMLYAPRGMGKTYFALSLALAIASGAPALKWAAPAPRRVLYVDGEMPANALQERVARLIRAAPALPPEDHLRFLCADWLPDGLPSIARPPAQAAIEAAMGDADVLVLDNLSTLANGLRENEADDWGPLQRWLLALRRAGKTVLLIHHAGKGGQQRGTSRREDALDTVIALRRPADYEPEQGARFEVCLEKARGVVGPDAAPFEAKLVEDAEGGLAWAWADLADAKEDRAADLLRNGLSIRDVADATGLSKSAVGRLKQRLDQERGHGRT